MNPEPIISIGETVDIKAWYVTYCVKWIYDSQQKTKLIVGTYVRSESQIPQGRMRHATFIESER